MKQRVTKFITVNGKLLLHWKSIFAALFSHVLFKIPCLTFTEATSVFINSIFSWWRYYLCRRPISLLCVLFWIEIITSLKLTTIDREQFRIGKKLAVIVYEQIVCLISVEWLMRKRSSSDLVPSRKDDLLNINIYLKVFENPHFHFWILILT